LKRSNRLILLIGFFLAAVAFVAVVMLLGSGTGGGGGNEPGVDALNTSIVVTTADVPLGTTLTADMVATQAVKNTEKPAGSYTLTSEVIGRSVTTQLTKGQLLDGNAFSTTTVNPDIARLLDPGKRAMAVQVDQIAGVGTLVKPGDRVDVVLAIRPPIVIEKAPTKEGQPLTTVRNFAAVADDLVNRTTVKVLVENLRVVGTLVPPPTTTDPNASPPPTGPSYSGTAGTQLVLLEVTPQQAELIRFAQPSLPDSSLYSLSLVLRAPGDAEAPPVTTTGITVRQLVDKYGVIPPKIILTEQP
jgi:Flp pilus assembly protein CpaB